MCARHTHLGCILSHRIGALAAASLYLFQCFCFCMEFFLHFFLICLILCKMCVRASALARSQCAQLKRVVFRFISLVWASSNRQLNRFFFCHHLVTLNYAYFSFYLLFIVDVVLFFCVSIFPSTVPLFIWLNFSLSFAGLFELYDCILLSLQMNMFFFLRCCWCCCFAQNHRPLFCCCQLFSNTPITAVFAELLRILYQLTSQFGE